MQELTYPQKLEKAFEKLKATAGVVESKKGKDGTMNNTHFTNCIVIWNRHSVSVIDTSPQVDHPSRFIFSVNDMSVKNYFKTWKIRREILEWLKEQHAKAKTDGLDIDKYLAGV